MLSPEEFKNKLEKIKEGTGNSSPTADLEKESYTIPEEYKDMNSMFYGCESLTTLDLSYFDVSKAEDMSSMFYGCGSLATLDLSRF